MYSYADPHPNTYPNCNNMLADCNADGSVDGLDIDSFLDLLLTGG